MGKYPPPILVDIIWENKYEKGEKTKEIMRKKKGNTISTGVLKLKR
jgi:hypothetical protein